MGGLALPQRGLAGRPLSFTSAINPPSTIPYPQSPWCWMLTIATMKSFEHVMVGMWYLHPYLMRILASTTRCHAMIGVWAAHEDQYIQHFCRQHYSIQYLVSSVRIRSLLATTTILRKLQQPHHIVEPWLAVAVTFLMDSAAWCWCRIRVQEDFDNLATLGQQLSD